MDLWRNALIASKFTGIYDFSYAPYALGDALTWQMNIAVLAHESKCSLVDFLLLIDPRRPYCRYQAFLNPNNQIAAIESLLPAFTCLPSLDSLKVIRDTALGQRFLIKTFLDSRKTWPSFWGHIMRKLDITSYRRINSFFKKNDFLPILSSPKGYENWAKDFYKKKLPGQFCVVVNMRQSFLSKNPMALHRDADLREWIKFFEAIYSSDDRVKFIIVGGYSEWTNQFLRLPNVLIPRTMGLGLAHELALLAHADLFMGSSSGYATMATFCGVPYVISHIEEKFSQSIEVPVGQEHFLFARHDQRLYWEKEDSASLERLYEQMRTSIVSRGKDVF